MNELAAKIQTPGVTVGESATRPLEPKRPADEREKHGNPGDKVGVHFISRARAWLTADKKNLVPDGHEDAAHLFASKAGLKFDESQLAGVDNAGEVMTRVDHVIAGDGEGLDALDNVRVESAMRAKVYCTVAAPVDGGEDLEFTPVAKDGGYDDTGSDENNTFAKFSPSGRFALSVRNPELLGKIKVGDVFYVDFIRAAVLLFLAFLVSFSAFAGTDPLPNYSGGILTVAGTPGNGTSCIQTITIGGTPTAGSFTLSFKGKTTGAIAWSATNGTLVANIDAALEALATLAGGTSVTTAVGTMTAGIGTITVTFTGNYAKLLLPVMGATSSLTGSSPTLAVAITTAGVTADGRSSAKGTLCVDSTNGILYQNQGTSGLAPTWVKVSAE